VLHALGWLVYPEGPLPDVIASRSFCVHGPSVLLSVPMLVLPGGSNPDRAEDDQPECEGSNEERPRSLAARWQ
jgi:hypothetical protein